MESLRRERCIHLDFLCRPPQFSIAAEDFPVAAPMSIDRDHNLLHELQEQLRGCETVTPDLMLNVIGRACFRFHAHGPELKARVARLIDCGAYIDAALALLEMELPLWKLRRLTFEDGAWYCALSKQPGVPAEIDDLAEASHESLPLAMLSAFVEARRISLAASEDRRKLVPQVRLAQGFAVCCDNFA